jgi:hypothetical protein
MRVAIPCGSCGRPLRLDQTLLGGVVRCPLCFDTFAASPDQARPLAEEAPPPVVAVEERKRDRFSVAEPEETPATATVVVEPERPARHRSGPLIHFQVFLRLEADPSLKGLWEAEADEHGLRLHQRGSAEVRVPIGHGNARFRGGNQLTVSAQGREIALTLRKAGSDQARLARDLADYLNNERGPLDLADYPIPPRLALLALVPLGAPLVAVVTQLRAHSAYGRLIWGILGLALAGLCFWMLRRPAWTMGQRLRYGGLTAGLAYGTLLVALVLNHYSPYAIDPRHWHHSAPGGYQVLMPGPDHVSVRYHGWWGSFNVVESRATGMDFAVGLLDPVGAEEASLPLGAFFEGRKADFLKRNVSARVNRDGLNLATGPPRYELVGVYRDSAHGEGVFIARLVRVADRVYLVAVAGPRVTENHPDVIRFLDSFEPDVGRPLPDW